VKPIRLREPPTDPSVANALGMAWLLMAKFILQKTIVARCQLTDCPELDTVHAGFEDFAGLCVLQVIDDDATRTHGWHEVSGMR
jgi:hypothetical protein